LKNSTPGRVKKNLQLFYFGNGVGLPLPHTWGSLAPTVRNNNDVANDVGEVEPATSATGVQAVAASHILVSEDVVLMNLYHLGGVVFSDAVALAIVEGDGHIRADILGSDDVIHVVHFQ